MPNTKLGRRPNRNRPKKKASSVFIKQEIEEEVAFVESEKPMRHSFDSGFSEARNEATDDSAATSPGPPEIENEQCSTSAERLNDSEDDVNESAVPGVCRARKDPGTDVLVGW